MNFIKKHIKLISKKPKPDYLLFILASTLFIVGIIFSYSLSIFTVNYYDYGQFHFLLRQGIVSFLAIIIMFVFAHIDSEILFKKYKIPWLLLGIFFLAMVAMPFLPDSFVTQSGGANRWIRLPGFSLSPVEFFKIGFIYFLAFSFHRKFSDLPKVTIVEEIKLLIPYGIVFLVAVFLIAYLQKDLGQIVLLGIVLFVLLIFVNRSAKLFIGLIVSAVAGVTALILSATHRIDRFQSWWSSVQDSILYLISFVSTSLADALRVKDYSEPYQVSNSLNAMNHGGFFGVNLSEGSFKLGFLSEVHTDFVLAGITEEIGVFGLFIIVSIFVAVIIRILRISRRVKNTEYHLFSLGIAIMLFMAFVINSYGVSGIIPIKGIAVPFLSYGGSSALSIGIGLGLVLSISKDIISDEEIEKQMLDEKKREKKKS